MSSKNPQTIRAISLFLNDDKLAEMQNGTYEQNSNDASQITDGGYAGHSDGATVTKITGDTIVPVTGIEGDKLQDAITNKKYLKAGMVLGGKYHEIVGRITSLTQTWNHTDGTLKGSFVFEGGEPEITSLPV